MTAAIMPIFVGDESDSKYTREAKLERTPLKLKCRRDISANFVGDTQLKLEKPTMYVATDREDQTPHQTWSDLPLALRVNE